ncbi:MAG: DUF2184 domain-containing protein, partial [Leptospira sp.]|nr:DUF2184 domain-containing protein [Leptospira sp.]
EDILYEAKKEELVARNIWNVNTKFSPWAKEIGWDWYDRKGSAKILSNATGVKDIPFVGETGGRETSKVYTIATGIRYDIDELRAFQAKAAGKGPNVSLDTLRPIVARRFVAELENKLVFVGDSKYGIVGCLNHTGNTTEDVDNTGTGSGAAKLLWANKTSAQIIANIVKAVTTVENDGVFKAKVLGIPPTIKGRLSLPYSDYSPETLMKWLQTEGLFFEKVVVSSVFKSGNNGLNVDCFMVADNTPEIGEIMVTQDLEMYEPQYDLLGNSEMAVVEKTAGLGLRHPKAVYVGKGI